MSITQHGFYWSAGDKKHQPLVLLPGFTGTHADLVDFAQLFLKEYFVIIPDFPGWGKSSKGTYNLTIQGYAQFVQDILKDAHIDKKILLFGHCMGSFVAIEFAYQYPKQVKQVFLVGVPFLQGKLSNNAFHWLSHRASLSPKFIRPLFYFFRSRLFAIPLGFFVIQTRSLKKKLSLIFKNAIKQQFQHEDVVEKNWDSMITFDATKIQKISVPIHLFHGEKDRLIPATQAEKLHVLCPQATFDVVPLSGHMPPIETPKTLANLMQNYR